VGQRAGELHRHLGVVQATALNVAMIVGSGVFITIPLMNKELPGGYALLGWLLAGALILLDGLVWGELGAALPGSGGTYHYLLVGFGERGWGRLAAFLFIWQFLLSGPLELASGLIAMDAFSQSLAPGWARWDAAHRLRWELGGGAAVTLGPARLAAAAVGGLLVVLVHNRVTHLGRLTLAFALGVLALLGWVIVAGMLRFDPAKAFDFPPLGQTGVGFNRALGAAVRLALFSYLGYYTICYMGDEVRDPGRTIPRAVLLSAALVAGLFVLAHLAFTGTVSWRDMPTDPQQLDAYSLPAAFVRELHGDGAAVTLVTLCLVGSCFASAFAGLVGYSRVPYGAARAGHFFAAAGAVHPRHGIPYVSLWLVGGLMLFWTFFDLQTVIEALIVTRVLQQFVAQTVAVALLRRTRPGLPRPFRIWFYPLPCGLALFGWLYVFGTAPALLAGAAVATLAAGAGVFLLWSRWRRAWPFAG
jgi:amino acid transporter